jgi:hypothetical protein
MELSLGFLGDLVWMRLPEARPLVAKRIEGEVIDAITIGRELQQLTSMSIASDVLWSPLLRRALEESPLDKEKVARFLAVIREAYLADRPEGEYTQYALRTYVLEWLAQPEYLSIVEDIDRDLHDIIMRDVAFS